MMNDDQDSSVFEWKFMCMHPVWKYICWHFALWNMKRKMKRASHSNFFFPPSLSRFHSISDSLWIAEWAVMLHVLFWSRVKFNVLGVFDQLSTVRKVKVDLQD